MSAAVDAWQRALVHPRFENARPAVRLRVLNALASVSLRRYYHRRDAADLSEAVARGEQALAETPEDSPHLRSTLENLGIAVLQRFLDGSEPADLGRAIELFEDAVAATPDDSPELQGALRSLGTALGYRYGRDRSPEDLAYAIRVFERGIEAASRDSPEYPKLVSSLGNCLAERYAVEKDIQDLRAAAELADEAMAEMPPDVRGRSAYVRKRLELRVDLASTSKARSDFEPALHAVEHAIDEGDPDPATLVACLKALRVLAEGRLGERRAADEQSNEQS